MASKKIREIDYDTILHVLYKLLYYIKGESIPSLNIFNLIFDVSDFDLKEYTILSEFQNYFNLIYQYNIIFSFTKIFIKILNIIITKLDFLVSIFITYYYLYLYCT